MKQLAKVGYVPSIFSHRDEFLTSFDKIFDEMMSNSFPNFGKEFGIDFFEKNSYPKCDTIDLPDKIQIEMEIPGVDKSDISIEIQNIDGIKALVISGKKSTKDVEEKKNYIRRELKRSAFRRSFKLHEGLEGDKINAEFKNGILLIDIPKREPEKVEEVVTKIDIK